MRLTKHAREQMRRRNISVRQAEAAMFKGKEFWRKGALLIMHGNLRLIVSPFSGFIITAWWQNHRPTRHGQGKRYQKPKQSRGAA